jgi:acyl carrier protein
MPTPTAAVLADEILAILIAKHHVPADTATVDTDFEVLGLDSLVLIEVAVSLNDKFGMDIEGEELMRAGTAAAAAEVLTAQSVEL